MNDMMGQMGIDLNDTLGSIMPKKKNYADGNG